MAKMKMATTSGATGPLSPVKGVAGVGTNYRGGEGGSMSVRQKDVEVGTNKGPMDIGKRAIEGGRRSHEHAMSGDRVHDQHIKSYAHSKTHMGHATEMLRKMHKE